MKIQHGKGKTEYGPGVEINLTATEVCNAISGYLACRGVHYSGPRTMTVNGELIRSALVYVYPDGFVINTKGEKLTGRGETRK